MQISEFNLSETIATFRKFPRKITRKNMDLTGRFPHKPSRENSYLFVLYDYDTNAILFEPLKTRQAHEITTAFKKCI